jgi:putative FmdB family regulatory protein
MPIFEYRCAKCGQVSEFLVGVASDEDQPHCTSCGSRAVEKVFSAHAAPAKSGGGADLPCGLDAPCANAGSCCTR